SDARGDEFGYPSFYNAFCRFGILQLIANGYAIAGLYQLMQVSVECMMWKSCQRHRVGSAVTSFSEGNAKDFSRDGSVAVECFIKIAHAKQQHGIGIAAFYFPVLLHHRSFFLFLCHSSK